MGIRTSLVVIAATCTLVGGCAESAQTPPPPRVEAAPVVPPLDIVEAMKQPDLPPRDEEASHVVPQSHTIGQNNPDPVIDSESHGHSTTPQAGPATAQATQAVLPRARMGSGGGGGSGRSGGGGGGRSGGGGRGSSSSGSSGSTPQSFGPQTMQ